MNIVRKYTKTRVAILLLVFVTMLLISNNRVKSMEHNWNEETEIWFGQSIPLTGMSAVLGESRLYGFY